ncbi:helix-turn-helix transcriptional regulator [Ligilactobacillus ruminis]|uniref:Helix-turn-helix transcriptional regulator n=1 Tax=Ligilactobacillus ruminis TaxID=1623 RepID=A0AAQ3AU48_9LACO|nr:helix-turn-helix transcriptional regulator [Ligilactobacillus ruminis]MDD5957966.1 helix-turn-helix transcriptional regulator [Ligilactobacillus ruminis]WDC82470.1 helix-turn-helix transcriptional regulator [Ligilactobacillus ruminis]
MTQEELAEYSNLSVNYISKVEREKKSKHQY